MLRSSATRHSEHPRADILDRLHQPVSDDEFVEDVLKHVLGFVRIGDMRSDPAQEPVLVPGDRLDQPTILFGVRAIRHTVRWHVLRLG
jgi:hypothetical protein